MNKNIIIAHKHLLEGFKSLTPLKYSNIKINDYIRYFNNNELKYGGFVKFINLEKNYIVLINYNKNFSWSLQLNDPKIKMFIRTKASVDAKKKEMAKIYKQYKEGKLKECKK